MFPEDVLNLVPETCKIKRLLNKTTDPLKLKERLHRRPRAGKYDDKSFPDTSLFLKVLVAIRAELAQIGQSVLAFRNANIKKHAIGLAFFSLPKTLRPIECGQDLIAKKLELLFNDLTDIILVIDHKKTFFILWHFGLEKVLKICATSCI